MAISPTQRNQSFAFVEGSRTSVGVQSFKLRVWVGRTTASSNTDNYAGTEGTELTPNTNADVFWELWGQKGTTYVGTSNIGAYLYIFPDNTDGAGAGTGNIQAISLSADAARTVTTSYTLLDSGTVTLTGSALTPGSYRVVPVLKKIDGGGAISTASVSASTDELYCDSDNNTAFSTGVGSDPAINTFVNGKSGWMRVGFDWVSGSTSVEPTQVYPNQPTVSYDATALTSIRNPKALRVGLVQDATPGGSWNEPAASVALIKSQNTTPTSGGAGVTTAAYNVDTDFAAALTKYRVRWCVGPTAGQSSTPAGEIAETVNSGTLNLVDTNDKAWVIFKSAPAGFTIKDKFTLQRDTDIDIGSSISVKKTAGGASGVAPFSSSGRTTAQDLFRRTAPVNTAHAIPYLRTFVYNAAGTALSGVSVKAQVITQNVSPQTENDQTLTTGTAGSAGNIDWNYTIATSHAAFNRYVKGAASRVAGSHVTTGPDAIASPPATFSAIGVAADSNYGSGPFPAYPKTVRVVGNAFAGTKEPTIDTTNVFGVNSEISFESIFTCDSGQNTVDGTTFEPTGAVNRNKNLGTGSLLFKASSKVDESTKRIQTTGRHNPRDVAGRVYTVNGSSSDELKGRYAAYNRTANARHLTPATDGNSGYQLKSSAGYGNGAGGDNGFQSLAAPTDPSTIAIYYGYSADATQSATFTLDATSTEIAGFTSDAHNFGYALQLVGFVAVDPTKVGFLTASILNASPGESPRLAVHFDRILQDFSRAAIKPDQPPVIYVTKDAGPGNLNTFTIDKAPMTAIAPDGNGKSADWEYTFTSPANGSYTVSVEAVIDGSALTSLPQLSLFVGVQNPSYRVHVAATNVTNPNRHFQAGDQLIVKAQFVNSLPGTVLNADTSPAPKVAIRRYNGSVSEFWDNGTATWKNAATQGPITYYTMTLNATDKTWFSSTITSNSSWTNDFQCVVHAYISGVDYQGECDREVTGIANAHDESFKFDGFALNGIP